MTGHSRELGKGKGVEIAGAPHSAKGGNSPAPSTSEKQAAAGAHAPWITVFSPGFTMPSFGLRKLYCLGFVDLSLNATGLEPRLKRRSCFVEYASGTTARHSPG